MNDKPTNCPFFEKCETGQAFAKNFGVSTTCTNYLDCGLHKQYLKDAEVPEDGHEGFFGKLLHLTNQEK